MKKITLIIAVLCMIVQFGFAQSLTVTGVVTSKDDGQPVIGASIVVKGTSNGTITDFDGNYTITADKGQTLVVSYVGMKTQEVVIKSAMQNIILVTDAEVLEEVVVTAMGCDSIVNLTLEIGTGIGNIYSLPLTIAPNPIGGGQTTFVNREFTAEEQYGLRVEVVNSVGQIISMQYPSHYPIAISGIDVSGLYYIRIVTGTGDLYVGKLIVK